MLIISKVESRDILLLMNSRTKTLHEQSLDGHLDRLDLGFKLRTLLDGDRGSNDGSRHPAGAAQSLFGTDKHIRDVFVLAEQRKVEDDLQWFSISSHHDEFCYSSVQCLGGWKGGKKNK